MSNYNKAEPQIKSESTTIIGVTNCRPPDPFKVASCFGSMSYTTSDKQTEGSPSQPMSVETARVVNSVVTARVNEAAVRRDGNEDF